MIELRCCSRQWKRISVSGRLRLAAKMASSRCQIVSWLPADETGSRRIDNKPRFSGSGRAVIFPRRQSKVHLRTGTGNFFAFKPSSVKRRKTSFFGS
jgi:hypothetical protein